ncbi:hypothetical protein [Emticicia sp. 17c]|uniref:hypothetical protein n=1 Tax=Emticicia sp. 17c TaxID=3127704 RepID=UPI00301DC8FE
MKKYFIGFCIACCLLQSCITHINEFHYFKDDLRPLPNYYRVHVRGYSFLYSQTRFYAGFFKSDAIDIYFNEFSQPKNGELRKKADSTNIHPIDGDTDKQLVVILSSNADAIADQIGNVTQTQNALKNLMQLTSTDKQANLVSLQDKKEILMDENESLFDIGNTLLTGVETVPAGDTLKVQASLLQLLNQLASTEGKPVSFKSFKEAREWFNKNGFPVNN